MAAHVITSIEAALDVLVNKRRYREMTQLDRVIAIMVHKLRALRTFLLCSTILEERLLLCSNDKTSSTLGSLLVRIENVVAKISVYQSSLHEVYMRKLRKYLVCVESLEEQLEQWYTSFLDFLLKSISPVRPDQVWDIANSVVENLNDFLVISGDGLLANLIEALKEKITFLRNFIRFGTLLCADRQQEFCDLLTLIQPLAISSAHVTVLLFSAREFPYSKVVALLEQIKTNDDPHLYESYTLALESFKNSRESCVSKLDLKNFTTFLLSTVWEMLQLDTAPVVSLKEHLQVLYEELRFLTIVLEKKLNGFVGKIRDITGIIAFDAGVIIFSLYERDFAIDHGLRDFVENIGVIRSEVLEVQVEQTSKFNFPKTTILGFLEFLLDYLTDVRISSSDSDTLSYVSIIREHLVFLKSNMEKLLEVRNEQEKLHQAVWSLDVKVAYKIELLIDHLVLGSVLDSFPASIQSIEEDMMIIKEDFMKIFDKGPAAVVGFETERSSIIDRLERGSKGLQVVAIVGMPGSGKTTLANMVYNDFSVVYYFHIRAWCSVSQVFNIRKTILELLKQTKPEANVDSDTDDLIEQLRRSLKRKKYLILIDDIWERLAFDYLKNIFPDDSNGSRLLLTSRNGKVAPEAIVDHDKPHYLRQLTESESLELLQKKLFPGYDWPSSLYNFGLEVATYCKGLPLTILIVAGILANTRQGAWKGVLESLRSDTVTTLTNECIISIELSYKHLPHHLKPCFLSFGAFPEDHLVSVKKLIWLWIAEGFVRKNDSERLEQVATEYLNMLIGRSLVMKAEERSAGGGVKECRMHDLLHDFCLRKANEELFLHVLSKEPLSFYDLGNVRRLCIHSGAEHFKESKLFCPHLRSLSFFNATDKTKGHDMSFIFRISKHLRVLAMDQVSLTHLPSEIGFLVQLRYLAIQVDDSVSPSIGNLTNLETLFLCPNIGSTKLPDTFWNLKKLRHLFSSHVRPDAGTIELPSNNLDSSCNLVELDSLSALYSSTPDIVEIQLKKFPNIRRLSFNVSGGDPLKVLSFSFLSQLQSLSLQHAELNSTELFVPESMKKLTFTSCDLSGDFLSTIAKLPNLEVLKVRHCSYSGNSWHMEEGEFSELKHLELIGLSIVRWTTACDDQLPKLEKLVLVGCDQLVEIPECLENVPSLKMIYVGTWQPGLVVSLVRKVEEVHKEWGNLVQVRVMEVSDKEEEKLGMLVSEDVEVSEKRFPKKWKPGRIASLMKKMEEEFGNLVPNLEKLVLVGCDQLVEGDLDVRVRNIGMAVSEDVEVSDEEETSWWNKLWKRLLP